MAGQRIFEERAKHAGLERVARMKRRSRVDSFDMELFFGRPLRYKAVIDHLRRTHACGEDSADEEEPTDEDESSDEEEPTDGVELTKEELKCWLEQWTQERLPFKPRKMSVGGDLNLPHEILEAILSHLPPLDLVVATGVNMTFRTIVQKSPTLQRKLFLRPTNKPREFVKKLEDGSKVAVATLEDFDGPADDSSANYDSDDQGDGHDNHDFGRSSTHPWVMAYEIAALCPLLVPERDDIVGHTIDYAGPRVVCLSRLAPLAEHWANMYLTNPPSTYVNIHLNYIGGYARQYNISAFRYLHCETGITFASLLDAIHSEGLVQVTRKSGCWPRSVHGDMSGDKDDTTVSLVIAELEEWWAGQEWGCMMGGRMELDLSRTTLEFSDLVFREWDEDSDDCYFRFGDGVRRYQATALKKAAVSGKTAVSDEAPQ
jgi:hypothetical protein